MVIAQLIACPADAIRGTGTNAPENSTWGKQSNGSIRVAWPGSVTAAEVSSPRASAAAEASTLVRNSEAYVSQPAAGNRSSARSTASNRASAAASTGRTVVNFEAT